MGSRKELSEATARGYRAAGRLAKGRILEQFCESTGYNRAYAAMLLRGYSKRHLVSNSSERLRLDTTKQPRRRGGRPPVQDAQVQRVLVNVWRRPDGNSALMLVTARLRYVAGRKWGTRKYMNMALLTGGTLVEESLQA